MVKVPEDIVPDVGVLVGRFQVPELHAGHRDVLDFVSERHDKKVLFLGNNATKISTTENPLDFQARRQMIAAEYPEYEILYIEDMWSDVWWSKKLDEQIANVVAPGQTVMLYGSRDSFLSHYHGRHPTQELEAEHKVSGTEIRNEVRRNRPKNSPEWRAGVVWGAHARFPTTYTTVDIAIFDETEEHLLLVRKPFEDKWRLPGGFAEPHSESFEADARREAEEETNLSITDPVYVRSFKIDDWRYRDERDKIKTLLFKAKRQFGTVKPDDDVAYAEWFKVDKIDLDRDIMPNHRPLVRAVIED